MDKDLLIPSLRVGIVHAHDLTDLSCILPSLDDPRWIQTDPEFCIVNPNLGHRNELVEHLNHQYRHSAVFVPTATDSCWMKVYDELITYSTHLLVVLRRSDKQLKEFLKSDRCPKRPTKVVMV